MFESEYLILEDGTKIAYTVHGKEHLSKKQTLPLVLIVGAACTQIDWARLLPHLIKKRTVLTFDHRGLGLSTYSDPKVHNKVSIDLLAGDVVALIEKLGWRDIDIVGFSMGGRKSEANLIGVLLQQILIFHRHPTNPHKLSFRIHHALLGGTYASSVPMKDYDKQLSAADSGDSDRQKSYSENLRSIFIRDILYYSFSPKWMSAPENEMRLNAWKTNALINRPLDVVFEQRRMVSKFSFVDELKYIDPSIKVLVVHGTDDHCAPFSCAEEILRACPNAKLVTIGLKRGQVPSYAFGHIWFEYFDVEVWVGVIESFLDQCTSTKL